MPEVKDFEQWELEDSSTGDPSEDMDIKDTPLQKRSNSASPEDGLIHKRPFRPSSPGKLKRHPIIISDSDD